jgi:hypothetical protein
MQDTVTCSSMANVPQNVPLQETYPEGAKKKKDGRFKPLILSVSTCRAVLGEIRLTIRECRFGC